MPTVFVYGPDALQGHMYDRLGPCNVIGPARLEGFALNFDKPNMKRKDEGFANIKETAGSRVHGVLYDLTRKQLETLEGYYGGYLTREVNVVARAGGDEDEHRVDATTFAARRIGRNLRPARASLDLTIRGGEENDHPQDFIEWLRALEPIDE